MGTFTYSIDIVTNHFFTDLPQEYKSAVLRAVLGDGNVANELLATSMVGFRHKIKKYFNYGALYDKEALNPDIDILDRRGYIQGLPVTLLTRIAISPDDAQSVLDFLGINGIVYTENPIKFPIHLGYSNLKHQIHYRFQENNQKDWTLKYNNINGFYLYAAHTIPNTNEHTGMPDPNGGKILAEFRTGDPMMDDWVEYMVVLVEPYILKRPLLFYYTDIDTGEFYIFYREMEDDWEQFFEGSSTIASLEDSQYPICVLREQFAWVNDKEFRKPGKGLVSKYYDLQLKSTERLLKKLGVKLPDIINGLTGDNLTLKDFDHHADPAKKLENAKKAAKKTLGQLPNIYLVFGVDVYSHRDETLEYLFKYFSSMRSISFDSFNGLGTWIHFRDNKIVDESDEDTDAIGQYRQAITWHYIVYAKKKGNPYAVVHTKQKVPKIQIEQKNNYVSITRKGKGQAPTYASGRLTLIHRLQEYLPGEVGHDSKKDDYEVLSIYGLASVGVVRYRRRNFGSTTFLHYRGDTADNYLGLYLPMSKDILSDMSGKKATLVAYDSVQFLMYVADREKDPWYTQAWFKVVIAVISVILTIFSGPGGAAFWVGMTAAQVLIHIAVRILIAYIARLIAQRIGGVLGVVVAMAFSIIAGNFASGGFENLFTLPPIETLLDAVRVGTQAFDYYLAGEAYTLQEELEDWEKESRALQAELDVIKGELSSPNLLLDDRTRRQKRLAESPEMFFQRTLKENPGELALIYPQLMTDISINLLLPT